MQGQNIKLDFETCCNCIAYNILGGEIREENITLHKEYRKKATSYSKNGSR